MTNHTTSPAASSLGIPGFRRIIFWDSPYETVEGIASDELTRADEEKLAANPANGTSRPAPPPAEAVQDLRIGDANLTVALCASIGIVAGGFAVAPKAGVEGLPMFLLVLLAGAVGAAVGAVVSAKARARADKRRREYTALLGRVQHLFLRADDELAVLAVEATREAQSVSRRAAQWPDLAAAMPRTPALAHQALAVHLAAQTSRQALAERDEMWRIEGLLEGTDAQDDDVDMAAVRAHGHDLIERERERAQQVRAAKDELMEAQRRTGQIMSSARAREYLSEEGQPAAEKARD